MKKLLASLIAASFLFGALSATIAAPDKDKKPTKKVTAVKKTTAKKTTKKATTKKATTKKAGTQKAGAKASKTTDKK